MKITNPNGPNLTILLPGPCNANCAFCFWNHEEGKIKPGEDYLDRVFKLFNSLSDRFIALSISGGEPTISPYFEPFLIRLARYRRNGKFKRVVLTTNGSNLEPFIKLVGCAVDHINISRHAIDSTDNSAVFGVKTGVVPDSGDLERIIRIIHEQTECDVTLNCVHKADMEYEYAELYVQHAKGLGADAVSFRKEAGDINPGAAEVESTVRHGFGVTNGCPVCRSHQQMIDGMRVTWKGSDPEPSLTTGGLYELVVHPDGNAYTDWGMTRKFKPKSSKAYKSYTVVPDHGGSDQAVTAAVLAQATLVAVLAQAVTAADREEGADKAVYVVVGAAQVWAKVHQLVVP